MSKSRKRRVTLDNANRRLPLSSELFRDVSPVARFDFRSALRALEDRRTWHPEGEFRPARSSTRTRVRTVVRDSRRERKRSGYPNFYSPAPVSIGFERPRSVAVCVRRQRRREVMFARRKAGRRGQRRPRFNRLSKVRCK